MSNEQIKLFENSPIRNYWDDEKEEWYFCILDVIKALTDSVDTNSSQQMAKDIIQSALTCKVFFESSRLFLRQKQNR